MSNNEGKIIRFPGQPRQGSLVLRIELVWRGYPVWRRLRIGDRATFWDLHAAIQDAVGWGHRHRHLFTVDIPATGDRARFGIPEDDSFYGREEILPSWQHGVALFARPEHPPFLYTYHLGEQWQHEVLLESIESAEGEGRWPACLDGAGACPPEGSGGPDVFTQLLEERPHVLPPGFSPVAFDPDAVVFCDPGLLWRDTFGGE